MFIAQLYQQKCLKSMLTVFACSLVTKARCISFGFWTAASWYALVVDGRHCQSFWKATILAEVGLALSIHSTV